MRVEGGANRPITVLLGDRGGSSFELLGREPREQLTVDPALVLDVGEEVALDPAARFEIRVASDGPGLGIGPLEAA
jgi:hypothetical protein